VLIVWKGGASRIKLTGAETIGVIIGVGACVSLIVVVFFLPWLYRRLIKNDWELKWYHIFMGPLLLRRPDITATPDESAIVQNYYRGHKTMAELKSSRGSAHSAVKAEDVEDVGGLSNDAGNAGAHATTGSKSPDDLPGVSNYTKVEGTAGPDMTPVTVKEYGAIVGTRPEGKFFSPAVLFWQFKRFFFRGVDKDIVSLQGKRNLLTGDLELMHAHAAHYNNKAEYMYSFLQVMTASAASFTHGANDVSKYIQHSCTQILLC